MALKLRVFKLYGYDSAKTLSYVLTREIFVAVLQNSGFSCVIVKHSGKSGLKSGLMSTALDSIHVICEGHYVLVNTLVILKRDLGNAAFLLASHVDNVLVNGIVISCICKIAYEALDTTLKAKLVYYRLVSSVVNENNSDACVKETLLSHTVKESIVIENRLLEYLGVGLKGNLYAMGTLGRIALTDEFSRYTASFESFRVSLTLVAIIKLYPKRKRVYDGCTNSVKTAGDLISAAAEFTARVENGINHLGSRNTLLRVNTCGDTSTVILYGNAVIVVYSNGYFIAVSCKSLVYGVIHDFVYKVMESANRGSTDIHTRSFSYRLKSFKNLYFIFAVMLLFDFFLSLDFFRHFLYPLL